MEHRSRALVSSIVIFLELLIPLRFPNFFWYILGFAILTVIASVFWIFDEVPNVNRVKEDWFSILFNIAFIIIAGSFSYSVANPFVQALLLGATGFGVYFSILSASRLKRGYTPSLMLRNIMSLVAILGIFMAISDILRWASVSTAFYTQPATLLLTFVSVFIVSEFLFEVQGIERSLLYSLVLSFGITEVIWVSAFWLVSYPQSTHITNLGVPLPAILSAIFFYLFWGISQHRLEGTLTRRVLWEYIIISTAFVTLLFATTKWLP